MQPLAIVAGILVWIGTTLILDARCRRDRRPDLPERLRPLRPTSLADEAHDWLDKQA